jgi:predicted PurR-regulated permease PerM
MSESGPVEQARCPHDHGVPVRTILVTIGLVLATLVVIYLVRLLAHIEALLAISAFFAVVITPAVDVLRRRLHVKRGLATTIVFLLGITLVGGMLYLLIAPLVAQTQEAIDEFPRYLREARDGQGPLGDLVKRFELDRRYEENRDEIEESLSRAGGPALEVAGRVFAGVVSLLTVLVLTFMMVLYGPELLRGALATLPEERRARVQAVAADCAKALTGYVMGNLLISVIAGVTTYLALLTFDVPFREALSLWVAFADLIPLVGATLGAIPTVVVAFLHSTTAGIGVLVFYVIYQQFENHVLQPAVMSKTVHINQLFVLVSVLAGVELFGVLGALLAIPVAGVISVIVRDLWDHRRGALKEEPTVGQDEIPVSEAIVREDRTAQDEDVQDEDVQDEDEQDEPGPPPPAGPDPVRVPPEP